MTDPKKLLNVPAEVLSLASDPPLIRPGRITCREDGFCDVQLDHDEPGFKQGMSVIVDAGEASELRVVGTIGEVQGTLLRVESGRVVRRDKRIFPRMFGGIRLRYLVTDPSQVASWMEGSAVDSDGWREPDPFMDFSGSGLKFEDGEHCKAGDTLLMELSIPATEGSFRATASVVRVIPISEEEREHAERDPGAPIPTHEIAVHFLELPSEAVEALMAFTLRVQGALI